jgi:hypothetical protein
MQLPIYILPTQEAKLLDPLPAEVEEKPSNPTPA